MSDFSIKQGDTLPAFQVIVRNQSDGLPVVVPPESTVTLIMRSKTNKSIVKVLSMTVEPGDILQRAWVGDDTSVPGSYDAEVEVVFPDGSKLTTPTIGYFTIVVVDDIADGSLAPNMNAATAYITEASLDTKGRILDEVPTGTTVTVFLDGQPVAMMKSVNGSFSLGVKPGSKYVVRAYYPGWTFADKEVIA